MRMKIWAVREVAVEAAVLLLVLDGEREHLAIGEVGEGLLRGGMEERQGGCPSLE